MRRLTKNDIPNIISFFRLTCVGVLIWMFHINRIDLAFYTYLIAMTSDFLDGYLARRYGWITDLGKLLDPFADKLLQIVTLACFWKQGYLTWIPFAIITVKELVMIIGGLLLLKERNTVVFSNWFGKIAAGLFFIAMIATFLSKLPWVAPWYGYLMHVAVFVSVAAMAQYAWKVLKHPSINAKQNSANTADQTLDSDKQIDTR
ncbi:MAG: CDP-alcohol phosphatidyltransferase family protein [Christensenellales bacterium]